MSPSTSTRHDSGTAFLHNGPSRQQIFKIEISRSTLNCVKSHQRQGAFGDVSSFYLIMLVSIFTTRSTVPYSEIPNIEIAKVQLWRIKNMASNSSQIEIRFDLDYM